MLPSTGSSPSYPTSRLLPTVLTTALLLLLTLTHPVLSLPTGAPKCQINPTVIAAAHLTPASAGYTITSSSTTYTPGQTLNITLTGSMHNIVGVLLYATPGDLQDASLAPNGSLSHVGSFNVPTGFRIQTQSICDAAKVVQDANSSTITHVDPSDKGATVSFLWTASANTTGDVSFNTAITSGAPGNPWQVLDVLTVRDASAVGTGATTATTTTTTASTSEVATDVILATVIAATATVDDATAIATATADVITSTATATSTGTHHHHHKGRKCHKKHHHTKTTATVTAIATADLAESTTVSLSTATVGTVPADSTDTVAVVTASVAVDPTLVVALASSTSSTALATADEVLSGASASKGFGGLYATVVGLAIVASGALLFV